MKPDPVFRAVTFVVGMVFVLILLGTALFFIAALEFGGPIH